MFLEQQINSSKRPGWIEVIVGSMFSGKTEELIRRLKRAEIAQQRIKVFKPKLDTRYDKDAVVSHDSKTLKSIPVGNSEVILQLSDDAEIIGIDEAQFFDNKIVDVCNTLANQSKRVIVAGLDMDFKGRPFAGIPALLACAEYVTKVHAICMRCGRLAQYSHRKTISVELVEIGEKDVYEPLCRACYNQENISD